MILNRIKNSTLSQSPIWIIIYFLGLLILPTGSYLLRQSHTNTVNSVVTLTQLSTAPATEPLPDISPKRTLSFIAVGDIMLSRTVSDKIRKYGFDYPFAKTSEYLNSADFAFGNLETSITDGPRITTGMMSFRADPGVESALKRANIQIVSLANNHAPNFGQKGLLDTFDCLKNVGIKYAGAGENDIEAHQPSIIEYNGIKLAILAYNDTDVVPPSYGAGQNRAGTALMNIVELQNDIKSVKPAVDYVIVSMHSGTEYTPNPNTRQTDFAHAAIDAGAELVIGHHPHVVQTIETYKNKLIMYSLGNFVFDQMWSTETRQGMAALITITADGVTRAQFHPIMIDDFSQPREPSDAERATILKRLDTPIATADFWQPPS